MRAGLAPGFPPSLLHPCRPGGERGPRGDGCLPSHHPSFCRARGKRLGGGDMGCCPAQPRPIPASGPCHPQHPRGAARAPADSTPRARPPLPPSTLPSPHWADADTRGRQRRGCPPPPLTATSPPRHFFFPFTFFPKTPCHPPPVSFTHVASHGGRAGPPPQSNLRGLIPARPRRRPPFRQRRRRRVDQGGRGGDKTGCKAGGFSSAGTTHCANVVPAPTVAAGGMAARRRRPPHWQ